jgi:hypothetical protein
MAKHPDDIWLEVGTERFKVRGDSLEGPERAEALARIAAIAARYRKYQEKTDREIRHRATDPRAMSERRRARRPAAAFACSEQSAARAPECRNARKAVLRRRV